MDNNKPNLIETLKNCADNIHDMQDMLSYRIMEEYGKIIRDCKIKVNELENHYSLIKDDPTKYNEQVEALDRILLYRTKIEETNKAAENYINDMLSKKDGK